MIESVTFKIFEFDRLGIKKYKKFTLNIKSIKTICCGGTGCNIYYKNGKTKYLHWYSDSIKEMLDEHQLRFDGKILWFDDETYNIFWDWYSQFPFDDICQELSL